MSDLLPKAPKTEHEDPMRYVYEMVLVSVE